jgi:hypothetical protein
MTELVTLVLATWRLSSLLAQEAGPFDAFARLRLAVGVWYDDDGEPHGRSVLAQGITCVWCNSVWVGVVLALAWRFAPVAAFWVALPLALSAGAVVVQGVTEWHAHQPS